MLCGLIINVPANVCWLLFCLFFLTLQVNYMPVNVLYGLLCC